MATRKKTTPERSEGAPQAARRTAGRRSTARTARAGRSAERERSAPSWELVSRRAFEIWQQAGEPHGHDLEHWLQAEAELRGK